MIFIASPRFVCTAVCNAAYVVMPDFKLIVTVTVLSLTCTSWIAKVSENPSSLSVSFVILSGSVKPSGMVNVAMNEDVISLRVILL